MKISYFNYLFVVFLSKLCSASNRFHLPKKYKILFNKLHDKRVMNDLAPYFNRSLNNLRNKNYRGVHNKRVIWMFWWQGKNKMPTIAKKCVRTVIDHSQEHRVIFIDKYNIKHFTNIPFYIYKKLHDGTITFTHFSDIVRFNLLMNYGGIWIDSTMYSPRKLDKSYFDHYLYTSGKYHGTYPLFVDGRWVAGLIGGNKGNSLFKFMNDFFKIYWKYNTKFLNYFLVDYGLYFSYNHNIGGFKDYIDYMNKSDNGNNPYLFKFINLLNKPYNADLYRKIVKHTSLFNLTYKKKFIDNGKTFYSKLFNK